MFGVCVFDFLFGILFRRRRCLSSEISFGISSSEFLLRNQICEAMISFGTCVDIVSETKVDGLTELIGDVEFLFRNKGVDFGIFLPKLTCSENLLRKFGLELFRNNFWFGKVELFRKFVSRINHKISFGN